MDLDDVSELLTSVQSTISSLQKFKNQFNREMAFDFDPIRDIWGFQETRVSALLAYFLDPFQKHGQGRVYLDSFIQYLKTLEIAIPDQLDFDTVKIYTEYSIGKYGRIDILIDFGTAGIVIENKIWTSDHGNQLSRYRTWMDEKRGWGKRGVLLYLTPYGIKPSDVNLGNENPQDIEPKDNKYALLSWQDDMSSVIQSWIDMTRATTVRSVLELFGRSIENEIGGGFPMEKDEAIIDIIWKRQETIEAAFAVAEAIPKYIHKMVSEIKRTLENVAKEKNIECTLSDFSKIYNGFSFSRKEWAHCVIRFEFQSSDRRNLILV